MVLRPKVRASEVSQLTIVGGLAVTQALNDLYKLEAQTKWPNDVLVDRRKICGILSEANMRGDEVAFVVMGVGLNANFDVNKALPKSIAATATSLETEMGHKVPLEQLLRTLLEKLEDAYDIYAKKGFSYILDGWKRQANFLGLEVDVIDRERIYKGIAEDIDSSGALILRLGDGALKSFLAADVSLRPRKKPV